MTRVAHVITGLSAGGAEQQLLALASESGTDATVVSLTEGGVIGQALMSRSVPVSMVGMKGNRDLLGFVRLVRLLRSGRYDAVHLHLFRSLVHGALAARLARVPTVVYTEHSLNAKYVEGRPVSLGVRLLYRLCTKWVDVVVAVSKPVSDRLREVGVVAPIRIVPNALDATSLSVPDGTRERYRHELGIDDGDVVIIVVGRLFHAKAVDIALRAISPSLGPHCRALIVGAGPEAEALRELATDLPGVIFTGERSDIAALLSASDVLVSASPEETYGLAIVEARLAGLPVVYVDCPALDGLNDPGARECSPGIESIRAALGQLLQDGPPSRVPPPAALLGRCDTQALFSEISHLYADPTGSKK